MLTADGDLPCHVRPGPRAALGLILLALVVIVLHGHSINDGLVLDDYHPRAELCECGSAPSNQ